MRCMLVVTALAVLFSDSVAASIRSVEVFPGQATVTREWQVQAQAGSGSWKVSDLPMAMQPDSARLEVLEGAQVTLGGVERFTQRFTRDNLPRAQQLRQQIAEQKQRIQVLQDRLASLALQQRFLDTQVGLDEPVAPGQWGDALERLGESAGHIFEQRRATELARAQAEEALSNLQQSLADLGTQSSDLRGLRIAYRSERETPVVLRLSYTVDQATWSPRYEWRLDTSEGQLRVEQFAQVRQSTGEDWRGVDLAVSLARPYSAGRLPALSTWWVSPEQPQPERFRAPMTAAQSDDGEALEVIRVTGSRLQYADLVGNDYAQRYVIATPVSISGDNTSQQFPLAEHTMDAELTARAVPMRASAAWLYVRAPYQGETVLPPGDATLFQDGSLVGETRVSAVQPGGVVEQSFGVDDRIDVEVSLLEDSRAEEGTFRTSVVLTRRYRIEIRNTHQRRIALTLLDQMPVSRDERIEVALTEDTTSPTRREVEEQPGRIAWDLDLAAGAEQALIIGYRLEHPEGLPGIDGW